MTSRQLSLIVGLLLLVGVFAPSTPVAWPTWPSITITAPVATRATYVYEQRTGSVPSGVSAAIDKLNRTGIVANQIDQHVLGGGDAIPAQYVVAMAEAKKAGIPCLVVEYSTGPPKVVKAPTTAEQVLEAAK